MLSPFEAARRRVLVVDDEPSVLELITTRLDIAGYETFYARDGYEAVARLSELRPAALILDINMPRLDGFGVLRQMKQTDAASRIATMVLTARNQPDDVRQAILLGARDFLAKPFNDQQLLTRVARLFLPPRPARRPVPSNTNDILL